MECFIIDDIKQPEKVRSTSKLEEIIYKNCSIVVWEVECNDCGFNSGLAIITFFNGNRTYFTGAGCFKRRDKKAVIKMAEKEIDLFLKE